jgi:hypothetical protein
MGSAEMLVVDDVVRNIPATDRMLDLVAEDIREEDADEVRRASGQTPLDAMRLAVRSSAWSAVLTIGDDVLCAYGLQKFSVISGRGYPWVLSTNAVDRHRREYARLSILARDYFLSLCPGGLEVMIDCEYRKAIRWAEWLGLNMKEVERYGPNDSWFVRAVIGGPDDGS